MTIWGSRLPFALDPLIAEAKRRMRRRRLLIVAMVVLLAGGVLGAALALSGSASPPGSAFGPSPGKAQPPSLNGLAARKAFCGNRYSTCHSPDGRWSVVYVNRSRGPVSYNYADGHVSGYAPPRVGCTLNVTHLSTGRRGRIHLRVPACDNGLWIGQTYLIQDPYYASPGLGRVVSVDPPSHNVKTLAYFNTYVVSPNEHWVAGEAGSSDRTAGSKLIAVLSPTSHTCRVVTRAKSPNQYLSVDRSPWELPPSLPPLTFKDPVAWHDVVRGGKKMQVVTGPGPGFTRNSRSVIVAEYQWTTKKGTRFPAIHKHLVKFNLSSLHTPCPTSVAPRS